MPSYFVFHILLLCLAELFLSTRSTQGISFIHDAKSHPVPQRALHAQRVNGSPPSTCSLRQGKVSKESSACKRKRRSPLLTQPGGSPGQHINYNKTLFGQ